MGSSFKTGVEIPNRDTDMSVSLRASIRMSPLPPFSSISWVLTDMFKLKLLSMGWSVAGANIHMA